MKVYGPYTRKDGRKHVCIVGNNVRQTVSYPKWLMENYLGRKLEKHETVDHIDNDITNNSIENLQILSRRDNIIKSSKPRVELECVECQKLFKRIPSQEKINIEKRKTGPYCTKSCAGRGSSPKAGDNGLKIRTVSVRI